MVARRLPNRDQHHRSSLPGKRRFSIALPVLFRPTLTKSSHLSLINIRGHVIEDDEEGDESDSLGTDTVTRPNQHGDKASGKAEFDYDSNPRRQTGPIKAISALLLPNELSVFGPTSRIKPSHTIRQRMMTRELSSGLCPNVSWERKEKRVTARAFKAFGRCQTEGPRTGDDGCLKDTYSDDNEEGCSLDPCRPTTAEGKERSRGLRRPEK